MTYSCAQRKRRIPAGPSKSECDFLTLKDTPARTGTELYLRQWDAQLTVVKNPSVKVTSVISHQNGKDREWPKMEQS
jgi:hypothetical protein